jgi:ABC-type antimicrobial peptide transport system permease subunit
MQDMPLSLAVHTLVAPESIASAVRRVIWAADPDLPITDLADMEQILDQELAGRRMQAFLLTVIAGLGWILATAGVYGILSYMVELQTAEIGIRMALGANSTGILRAVMARCLWPVLTGVILGASGA